MADTNGYKKDLIVTRLVDAPVERVWQAWTDPEQVMRWWGPEDYTSPSCTIELREGGKYTFHMRAPQEQGGFDQYSTGIYCKIVPMERLEFTQSLSDKDGNPIDPAAVGMPADFPTEMHMVVDLKKAKCDMTELTVTECDWTVGQMYVYSLASLHQSLDKLAKSVAEN